MKKLLTLALVLVMVLSMATMGFAAETKDFGDNSGNYEFLHDNTHVNEPPYTASGNVGVAITPPTTNPVYCVNVTWGDLIFEYSFGTEPEWNPEDHTYSGGTNPGWQGATSGTVVVTNHSNAAMTVSHTLSNNQQNDVEVSATWDKITLESADEAARYGDSALADTCTLTVAIVDPANTVPDQVDDFTIGVLTITISKA